MRCSCPPFLAPVCPVVVLHILESPVTRCSQYSNYHVMDLYNIPARSVLRTNDDENGGKVTSWPPRRPPAPRLGSLHLLR